MKINTYEFTVYLIGRGKDPAEAWDEVVETLDEIVDWRQPTEGETRLLDSEDIEE